MKGKEAIDVALGGATHRCKALPARSPQPPHVIGSSWPHAGPNWKVRLPIDGLSGGINPFPHNHQILQGRMHSPMGG